MSIAEDIAHIARQERELILPAFGPEAAWLLGTTLRDLAIQRGYAIVIDIRRFGQPHQPLFYAALPGTTPDNARWVQRKSNVVARFYRSSYSLGLKLQLDNTTFAEKYSLPDADYATHGGSFPLHVAEAGIIGSVTVSGLPQRADHELAVEALCLHTNRSYADLRLPSAI
ncbi:heme-degrading domain-containing protein [Granulicella arctica]|uniref:UPF0303 protein HDF17_001060 n=1 Tax=Granulicella arctica TaxID=940613 RepID=A0A7Y9PF46_9BACT|nr:heme-degrading domain-containing protein [Granulicella arctica]NYF78773.1 uncharacterized protein (UPF0303 family) [Granulicella arctica]